MERRFDLEGGGRLTVREEGLRAVLDARRPDDGRGLYRAYLQGAGGRALLGTLAPEGGALRICRTLSLDELRRQGAWPPTGGRVELAFSFAPPAPLPGWQWAQPAELPLRDGQLRQGARRQGRALFRREGAGFALAYPLSPREPFPFVELFCLAEPVEEGGRRYVRFHFGPDGWPRLPEGRQNGGRRTRA